MLTVVLGDGDPVGSGVNGGDGYIRAWLDPMLLAATRIVISSNGMDIVLFLLVEMIG